MADLTQIQRMYNAIVTRGSVRPHSSASGCGKSSVCVVTTPTDPSI